MGVLIDSSIFIAAERGCLDLTAALNSMDEHTSVAMSAVTASELLHGVHRASGVRRTKRESYVEGLLCVIPVVDFTLLIARVHAGMWASLLKKGQSVGERDLLIAATAISLGYSVATTDLRSFPRIPGVSVLDWSANVTHIPSR